MYNDKILVNKIDFSLKTKTEFGAFVVVFLKVDDI